jgi:asparagine synthase (glutamine-hydrolysing)
MIRRGLDSFGTLRVVGLRSIYWYAVYRIELRCGISRHRTPLRTWEETIHRLPPKALEWNPERRPAFFFDESGEMSTILRRIALDAGTELTLELENIQKGSYRLWEDSRHELGFPPDWNRNPLTDRTASAGRHWTAIDEQATGDIKGLWELSRFSLAFRLARAYAATGNERAPEVFWQLVESWMGANPPNAGPQWISSQEVALRAMAWIFALHAFARSPATTAARVGRMLAALDAHARRIEATLAYAKAQNNNHLISEATGLFTIGSMFPELPSAARWSANGRSLLEGTAGQFFPDGGYIQHSINYHRLALQLYAWALRLAEIQGKPFSTEMYSCVDRSLVLLFAMVDPDPGRAPNFGHNDGALFLALNSCAYEDYRPLLQMISVWRRKTRIWEAGPWDEDALWLLGGDARHAAGPASPRRAAVEPEPYSAPEAGLYLMQGRESRAVIRCARFHGRPAHADQLHVDLWWRGENIACDAGSYLYGGDPPWRNSLTHAALHNTLTVDGLDQMTRSGRFGWASLAQARGEFLGKMKWQGSHDGYRAHGVTHRRTVERMDEDVWIVTDDLTGRGTHTVRLHWLIPDYPWEWDALEEDPALQNLPSEKMTGWKDGSGKGLTLRTPVGNMRLALGSSESVSWSVYRAGERVSGTEEQTGPVPVEIRGWRSLWYASKVPALSVAGVVASELPIRFISIWFPSADSIS